MTRKKTYQKGNLDYHRGCWTVRYRELDLATNRWTLKRHKLEGFTDPKMLKTSKALKAAADAFIEQVNERNKEGNTTRRNCSPVTFKQFVETRWKAYSKKAKHQVSTVDAHNSFLKTHLLPFFGEMHMQEIEPGDISDFLDGLRAQGLSNNTLHCLYGLARLIFDIAWQLRVIPSTPIRPKLHRPDSERAEKPTLTPEEIRAVLAASVLSAKERLLAKLLAVTGMRLGEGMALRWQDFDEVSRELAIRHTLYKGKLKAPKTKSSKQTLKLPVLIAEEIVRYKEGSDFNKNDDFIFCRKDGTPLSPVTLRSHLYKAMDEVKIKRLKGQHGFHIFRHSAGSILYKRSRDVKMVQGALRHADIATTSGVYIHLDDEVLSEGTEMLMTEIFGVCDPVVTQQSELVS